MKIKLLLMTVSEFSEFVLYNDLAYLWIGAMVVGLLWITFFTKGYKKKVG